MSEPMLQFQDVDVFYGVIQALKQVSLEVNKRETVALIGANGAGKSTLLMSVFGQPRIRNGQILFCGEDISHKSTHYVATGGIAQAPEGRRIFPDMSVEENLLMGTIPVGNQHAAEDMQSMFDLFPRLKERRNQRAMTLSGGEQQMLAIARALMSRPKLLLLDEPTAWLDEVSEKQFIQHLHQWLGKRRTLVVTTHRLPILDLVDRIIVLENGKVVMDGPRDAILRQHGMAPQQAPQRTVKLKTEGVA
ncbi:ABC transporter ATP-binding protein [Enterobacter hormaechei]|uniref:ABC transporter ATP-binding protein n=3 Tax=Enterobacteriaceae TaxID=543 RepID=A0A6L3Y1R2_9ENTR|nr:ABC transporter ATP-binding protein [Enterobacter hormaechei]